MHKISADFDFLFISGTFFTNPANKNDTHLQIVLIMLMHTYADGQKIHQTCMFNGETVLLGLYWDDLRNFMTFVFWKHLSGGKSNLI